MIYIRGLYPNSDRTRLFVFEILRSVATLPVESVSQAGEPEGIIDNPMLNESTFTNCQPISQKACLTRLTRLPQEGVYSRRSSHQRQDLGKDPQKLR